MGLAPSSAPPSPPLPPGLAEQRTGLAATAAPVGEGLFRSRFAEEAGLTPDQVARLEGLGLFASSEGLLPVDALPLARAVGSLLASGASLDDVARISEQVRLEATLHRRLLDRERGADPLARALRWQEQVGAVGTIRNMLLWRWSHAGPEEP